MTEQHPLAPPRELVQKWYIHNRKHTSFKDFWYYFAAQAAQWGGAQELEACCEWLENIGPSGVQLWGDDLRAARRPKSPSLKEQALIGLSRIESTGEFFYDGMKDLATIRRALEALPNDQH
jgi:hypothetical protein